jgi:hypothetical protein
LQICLLNSFAEGADPSAAAKMLSIMENIKTALGKFINTQDLLHDFQNFREINALCKADKGENEDFVAFTSVILSGWEGKVQYAPASTCFQLGHALPSINQ